MKLLNKHGPCIGLTLWKWNNIKVELWYAPPNFKIEAHTHPSQDIRITFIYGNARFSKKSWTGEVEHVSVRSSWDIFSRFNVRNNECHCFQTFGSFLLFVNKESYLKGYRTSSAAVDFVVQPEFF